MMLVLARRVVLGGNTTGKIQLIHGSMRDLK